MHPVSTPLPRRLAEAENGANSSVAALEYMTPLQRVSSNNITDLGWVSEAKGHMATPSNGTQPAVGALQTLPAVARETPGMALEPLFSEFRPGVRTPNRVPPAPSTATKAPFSTRMSPSMAAKPLVPSASSAEPPLRAPEPLYYRPPVSSGNFYGVKHLIPPQINRSFFRPNEPKAPSALPAPESDPEHSVPSGEWTSIVVQEALRRQVNTDTEFRRLGVNVLLVLAFQLAVRIARYVAALLQAEFSTPPGHFQRPTPTVPYMNYVVTAVYGLFFANIALALFRLLRSKDQCLDLPLTNRQRELCGLDPLVHNDDTALKMKKRRFELAHQGTKTQVPRYEQAYAPPPDRDSSPAAHAEDHFHMVSRARRGPQPELSSHAEPQGAQFSAVGPVPAPTGPLSRSERSEAERSFNRRFNIDFL